MGQARAIGSMAALNLVSAALSVGGMVVIARLFGAARQTEVFLAASTLASLVARLSQANQLAELFLPTYHQLSAKHGKALAQRAFSVLFNWVTLALLSLCALLAVFAGPLTRLLVPGFSEADHALGAVVLRWNFPILMLQVLSGFLATLLNAEHNFGVPEASGVASRVAGIAATLITAAHFGTWALLAGQGVAVTAQFVLLLGLTFRLGYRHSFRLSAPNFDLRGLVKNLIYTLGYVGATQVYAVALNAAVSLLPQGAYAVFKYVEMIYDRLGGILLRPVAAVFYTHYSEAFAKGSQHLRSLASIALGRCLAISVLAYVSFRAFGAPVLELAWGTKRFTSEQVSLGAWLLSVQLILLLASGYAQILRKIVLSAGYPGRLYLQCAALQIACAFLATPLVRHLDLFGLLAVWAVNASGFAAIPAVILALRRRDLLVFYPFSLIWRYLLAGGLAALTAMPFEWYESPDSELVLVQRAALVLTGMVALIGTFGAVSWVVGVPDARNLIAALRARLLVPRS